MLGDQEVCNFFSVAATTVFDCCGLILVSSATQNYILNSVSTAMKFDTDFSYVAPVLLYVACSKHARTPRHMYSVRSLFTRSPVRVKRASHGKRYEKIRVKLDPVPRRGFHTYFRTFYRVAETHYYLRYLPVTNPSASNIQHAQRFISHGKSPCAVGASGKFLFVR
eukprot:scpid105518/ scgid5310/ 